VPHHRVVRWSATAEECKSEREDRDAGESL
jgi:hypothetical protein